uniref:uncharacterized protein LOC122608237 n=1 Tax=Erigeron canadensis TaxID=72917 RepID=UPI001CB89F1A|nr:uncharacterized protein LOC122608237 [Erigeron canadensis]
MASITKEFEHLRIPLEKIKEATNSFRNTPIGSGGFGAVYKGEMLLFNRRIVVAIKHLNRHFGQGNPEFLKEIQTLSRYKHQNLILLLGFCDEEGHKVLVYEYAPMESLDRHLCDPSLTWTQRIKICVGAAKGLCYLHDPRDTNQRVLHCDVKSANILLDENMTAKVADFGLSKIRPANQGDSVSVTNAVGTPGYVDPQFMENTLTKESDVYSFGVVLSEVLCGRLCYDVHGKLLIGMWKQKYMEKKLDEIMFQELKTQMHPKALEIFSDVAFQCLRDTREGRPAMSIVAEKLEKALGFQEIYDIKLPEGYMEVYRAILLDADPPLNFTSEEELKEHLVNGTLLNGGKTWFSINLKGEHCELISIAECLTRIASESIYADEVHKSRFAVGCYKPNVQSDGLKVQEFRAHVKTGFLSPRVTYTVNLVLKKMDRGDERYIGLNYKLGGEISYAFLFDDRQDGWSFVELFQFTSEKRDHDLKIVFHIENCPYILVEGIEFRPLEKVEHEVLLNSEREDLQPITDDSETFSEQILSNDYKDILEKSTHGVRKNATKKEIYSILRKGFLINDGQVWFSLAKDGMKCLMLSARATLEGNYWSWKSLPKTRFEVAQAQDPYKRFEIFYEIESSLLSPQTTYAAYLVYKQEADKNIAQPPPAHVKDSNSRSICVIFFSPPLTPVIINGRVNHTHWPMNRPIIKGLPQQRSDGWMEVQIWEFCNTTTKWIMMDLDLSNYDKTFKGLEVQGIELRPK